MTLAHRTQALLELVESDRRAQCEAILAEAREQAAALLAQARAEARARVKLAFAEERARAQALVDAARADLQTRRRLHEQRHVETLLALGWQRLPEALRARWEDGQARRGWIEGAVARARAVLPRGAWQVVHAEGWPADEQRSLAGRLAGELGATPRLTLDARIAAGLRIVAAGNVVDATLAGLLADRDEIGGALIGLLEKDR
jgi:hypothetical protein